jgi:hypothetical protein
LKKPSHPIGLLKEYPRERNLLAWAELHNMIAYTLTIIGERTESMKTLEEAVATARQALTVYSRKDNPVEWAMTQDTFGSALRAVGQREKGTQNLEAAANVLREALSVPEYAANPELKAISERNLARVEKLLAEHRAGS